MLCCRNIDELDSVWDDVPRFLWRCRIILVKTNRLSVPSFPTKHIHPQGLQITSGWSGLMVVNGQGDIRLQRIANKPGIHTVVAVVSRIYSFPQDTTQLNYLPYVYWLESGWCLWKIIQAKKKKKSAPIKIMAFLCGAMRWWRSLGFLCSICKLNSPRNY